MNSYLIPANTKKSTLILGILRPFPDLMILICGTSLTVGSLIFVDSSNTWKLILACIPMLISVLLIMPIPNYHNTLVGIQSILNFYNQRRNFIWKGWCSKNEFEKANQ